MHRSRPLPALRIEVGAAQRTAGGERRDALSALWAIAGMHVESMPVGHLGSLSEVCVVAKNRGNGGFDLARIDRPRDGAAPTMAS